MEKPWKNHGKAMVYRVLPMVYMVYMVLLMVFYGFTHGL
jgi:hypothetical protein